MVASKRASRLDVIGSLVDVNNYFYDQGWTDGLPIIPPTEELVFEMLEACPLAADQVLGRMPPMNGSVTPEKIAINAVMAGCKPDYMPVVVAAVKAVMQPQFNVAAITTTTGGAAPAIIVSGPIADKLGINSGTAVFGSGHQANAINKQWQTFLGQKGHKNQKTATIGDLGEFLGKFQIDFNSKIKTK